MNTETAPETQEESLSESSSGSAWAGIAVVLGFVVGAVGLWFIQGDDSSNVKVPCLLYTSPSPRDRTRSRMPSSA